MCVRLAHTTLTFFRHIGCGDDAGDDIDNNGKDGDTDNDDNIDNDDTNNADDGDGMKITS